MQCNGSRPKCTMCIEMGLECAYQLPAIAPEKGSEYRHSHFCWSLFTWSCLTCGSIGRQPSTQLEGRLNSIEETLQRLLEENRRLSDSQGLLSTPFERASQSTVHVGLETNLSGAHEIVDNDYQGQIPPEDTVDGMGTTTFADEQESGFFGTFSAFNGGSFASSCHQNLNIFLHRSIFQYRLHWPINELPDHSRPRCNGTRPIARFNPSRRPN